MRCPAIALVLAVTALSAHAQTTAAPTAEDLLTRSKAVLARIEGEVKLPGLRQPVEVLRDRWGVPHIYAQNADDLFFAQGFVAAQDRLFQLDLWRRVGIGETAEVLGQSALEGDRFARLVRYRGDPEAEWASYSPDTKRIATAFTDGINAHIEQVQDRLPVEFQVLGYAPKRWRPEDVLGRMSGVIMTSNFDTEVYRAQLINAVGVEVARRLAPTDPPREFGPVGGLDLAGIDAKVLAGHDAAVAPLKFRPAKTESNNWAVSGARSASGKPLLASDPHRSIALPSLRYLVHLNAPGWNVIGSGEPGLPGVAIGHNERIAWGFTIVGTDMADVVVEELNPADPNEYRADGRWAKMETVREQVPVKGEREPVAVELRFTRHGPVIHEDRERHRAYALKWAGSEPGTAAYLPSLAVNRARNLDEFKAALARWKLPCQNMVYADVDGNIGWVATALTPVRRGHDGLLPVPGDGPFRWAGFLPFAELPQEWNPARGWVASANHNILPPGYQHDIAFEWAPPYRFRRVKQRLEAQPKFTAEDFQDIQHENTSLPGRALVRLAQGVEVGDDKLRPYWQLLRNWDGVLSREAAAGPLYAAWLKELQTAVRQRHLPKDLPADVQALSDTTVVLGALENPDEFWFGSDPRAKRDEMLRSTFARAVESVKEKLGPGPARWSWGALHTVTFRHPLATLGPAYEKALNLGPVGRPGDVHTPNNTRYNDKYEQIHGASYRQVFDLADWDRGMATSTPGQSGQPGSPHYGDLLPLWAEGRYFPLAFSRARVEEVTRHRLRLVPADS